MQHAATLLVLLAATVLSFTPTAAAQAEPPTKLSPEAEAVVDALRTYNNAMMAQDQKTMSSVQHAVTEGEKKIGEASVRMDMAVGRLKNAATEVFGDKAAAAVGLAVRDISNDEIPHATVSFEGEDKATIGFVAPSPVAGSAVKMIRVDGKWKFDLTQPEGVQDRLVGAAAEYETRTKAMDELTASVKARTFDSLDELIQEIGKRAS